MKSNFKFFAVAIAAIMAIGSGLLSSCDKEQNSFNDSSLLQSKGDQNNLNMSDSDRESFAREIAMLFGDNIKVFNELNQAIHVVTEYGLDENLKIYDILQTNNSVFLRSASQIVNLRAVINGNSLFRQYGFSANDYYGDLQFYWPYHDEWDGNTIPIICFAPEDENAGIVDGFHFEGGNLMPVHITETFVDDGDFPVIIINQSETHYPNYPNFKRGIWEKNGVVWGKPSPILPLIPVVDNSSTNNKVYEARSVTITSSGTQYDNFIAGGSEFELQSIYAVDAANTRVSTKARAEFTRKQIKNGVTKNFGAQLHENWQPGLGNIHLRLTEEDAWGGIDPIVINLDVSGNTLSTTININSTDDIIFDAQYTRSNYFNRCNTQGGVFYLGTEQVNCMLDVYDSYGD